MILPFSFLLLSIGIYAGIIENFERSIIAKLIFVLFVLYDLAKHASASRRQRFLAVPAEEAIGERLSCREDGSACGLRQRRTTLMVAVRHVDSNGVLDGQAHVCAGAAWPCSVRNVGEVSKINLARTQTHA